MGKIARKIALAMITFYSWFISPLLAYNCRFHPTCSSYTGSAIKQHGLRLGSWLGFKRILRCNPWHAGGYDPVPEQEKRRYEA